MIASAVSGPSESASCAAATAAAEPARWAAGHSRRGSGLAAPATARQRHHHRFSNPAGTQGLALCLTWATPGLMPDLRGNGHGSTIIRDLLIQRACHRTEGARIAGDDG